MLVYVDLADFRCQRLDIVLQVLQLRRRQAHHVVGHVGIHQLFLLVDRLEQLAQFGAQLRPLVAQLVIGFFQFVKVFKGALLAVGHFDAAGFAFVRVEILLLAFLRGRTACGLHVVG